MHSGDEYLVVAVIAIVDYFHGPHGLASEELAPSGLIRTKIARGLIESHPTNGTGHLSNTLWTNSIPIHHPEENEFFAAIRAPGDKLVRKALSHTGLSALYSMESSGPSLPYDGDHGAVYPLIILFALQTIASAQCLNSRPGRCLQFRGQQVRMSLARAGRPKGDGGVFLWPGRCCQAASSRNSIRGLGLHEELGHPGAGKKAESSHAKCATKEKPFFRITSSEPFPHPLVRE